MVSGSTAMVSQGRRSGVKKYEKYYHIYVIVGFGARVKTGHGWNSHHRVASFVSVREAWPRPRANAMAYFTIIMVPLTAAPPACTRYV